MKALYAASLPERAVRSFSALSGGALREASELLLPAKVRESALFRATAGIGLRFLIEQVGDVHNIYPKQDPLSRRFVMRYATGTSIELVSIATLFVSPVWVLGALGDLSGASKGLFEQIGDALKAEGLLEPEARLETMMQVLDGLERTSTHLALTINMPPLDITGMRREWAQFQTNLATLPPAQLPSAAEVERAWNSLQTASRQAGESVFHVSLAMGMSAVGSNLVWLSRSAAVAAKTTGMVVGAAFLDHFAAAGREIGAVGFKQYWAKQSRQYLVAAIRNFLPERKSWTERILGLD